MEDFINKEIEKLEAERQQLEASFHRLTGAITAYKIMLAEINKPKTEATQEAVNDE